MCASSAAASNKAFFALFYRLVALWFTSIFLHVGCKRTKLYWLAALVTITFLTCKQEIFNLFFSYYKRGYIFICNDIPVTNFFDETK